MKIRFSLGWAAVVALLLLASALYFLPAFAFSRFSPRRHSTATLYRLHRALNQYADAHHGQYPRNLAQLYPHYLDVEDSPTIGFYEVDLRRRVNWLYFPPPDRNTLPLTGTIIAAAPIAATYPGSKHPERLVLHFDGSISSLPEEGFYRLLTSTRK